MLFKSTSSNDRRVRLGTLNKYNTHTHVRDNVFIIIILKTGRDRVINYVLSGIHTRTRAPTLIRGDFDYTISGYVQRRESVVKCY